MFRMIVMILPFAVVLLTVIGALVRTIARVWVRHRVQMVLLEKLEERPELLETIQDVQDIVEEEDSRQSTWKPDFVQTGAILVAIGIASAIGFGVFGRSQMTTAAYFGGVMCVCLGFILAVVGLLARYLTQSPIHRIRDEQ